MPVCGEGESMKSKKKFKKVVKWDKDIDDGILRLMGIFFMLVVFIFFLAFFKNEFILHGEFDNVMIVTISVLLILSAMALIIYIIFKWNTREVHWKEI